MKRMNEGLCETTGRLDRIISEMKIHAKRLTISGQVTYDEADIQTLKHHAEDMLAMGEYVLDKVHEATAPSIVGEVPNYVQQALDEVRADLLELKANLEPNGYWHNQPDIEARVENWQFNTWRRMEETLTKGVTDGIPQS